MIEGDFSDSEVEKGGILRARAMPAPQYSQDSGYAYDQPQEYRHGVIRAR